MSWQDVQNDEFVLFTQILRRHATHEQSSGTCSSVKQVLLILIKISLSALVKILWNLHYDE